MDDLGRIRNGDMSEQELLTYCRHHPKADLWPALCSCVEGQRDSALRLFLEQGVQPTNRVAESVARSGNCIMAGLILEHGGAVNQRVGRDNTIGTMLW